MSMVHRLLRQFVPALLAIVLILPAARADNTSGELPVLHLNVSANGYPPYLIVGNDGKVSGIVWDLVNRIAQRLDYRVQGHRIPRKRVDQMLLDGYIDATPRAREWTREPDRFLFTEPMVVVREVLFTRTDSEFDFQSIDQLAGLRLVTPLGYHYPQLTAMFSSGQLQRFDVTRDRDMFTYLLHGNDFDAAIADEAVGQWLIRENGWQDQFRSTEGDISEYGYRLMLRPDWTDFARRFNAELEGLRASGELDAIRDRYR